jgi:hypothetical protein
MCVRASRVARPAISALVAASLLSGCASLGGSFAPSALGGAKQRSIKDDAAPAALAPPPPPAPRPQKKVAAAAPPKPYRPAAGSRVEPPSCTGTDCIVRLKALIADPERRWISERPSPIEFANGTRLFAYRALRDKLTCAELTLALTEIDRAATTFRSPVPGVSARQASNVLALNAAVGQELRTEFTGRCKG